MAEFERLIAAPLTHPGIAAPLAAGIDANVAYLVLEFAAADSLDIVVRDHGPAPPATALRLAVQLAGALDFASALNVDHGALHPRDVLVATDQTRMTGLGVVRALDRVGVPTPLRRPYTAPERIAGAGWDRRADIFSLAALLHEMLWGRRIAAIGEQAADALTEIADADMSALRAAFARALAENPADRFDTALEFAAALKVAFPGVPGEVEVVGRTSAVDDRETRAKSRELLLPLDVPEPELRPAEAPRYQEIEEPPASGGDAFAPPSIARGRPLNPSRAIDADLERPIPMPPAGFLTVAEPDPISVLERSRSAMRPLALVIFGGALVLFGVALGFGAGYAMGNRDRTAALTPAAGAAPAVEPPPAGREFTDAAISDASTQTPTPTPAAPTAAPAPVVPPAASAGRLTVRTTPAGARVFVDGRDHGRTPASLRDLPRGAHRVRLVREGYETEERRVVINASHPAQALTVALARTPQAESPTRARGATPAPAGSLSVDSRPPGANVFIDGKLAGATPLVVPQIGAGEHAVRLEHDGYQPWSSSVRIVSGERNRVTASLEK